MGITASSLKLSLKLRANAPEGRKAISYQLKAGLTARIILPKLYSC